MPVTRFSAIDDVEGCTKRTDEPLPIEKLLQFTTALSEVCLMVVCAADCVIVAEPAETVPPLGPAAKADDVTRHTKPDATHRRPNAVSIGTRQITQLGKTVVK